MARKRTGKRSRAGIDIMYVIRSERLAGVRWLPAVADCDHIVKLRRVRRSLGVGGLTARRVDCRKGGALRENQGAPQALK